MLWLSLQVCQDLQRDEFVRSFLFVDNNRSWTTTFQDDDKGQQQIAKYSIKNPGQVINSAGVFYIFPILFYDFFSGLDSRELFVQVASPSVLGFSAFDKFLREFRVVAHQAFEAVFAAHIVGQRQGRRA